ncbi:gamma carbonic anhydrase family protein [Desulfolucanica intricata]|uniref:gamma carbonic anhydrase family protein n=1 Tax=Desulfolucanica intricata TaxID=1285191 RepID=UPI00082A1F22|nr:gamma carbonic anhydrase family protein [Desulfolucanica intricata]
MLHKYLDREPEIKETVFVAPGAHIIGRVKIGDYSGVWFNAVIRGDEDEVIIGERTNIQDGAVVHEDEGFPTIIGNDVTVGHKALLHGCKIGNGALIGMGAIILNGAVIGDGAVVAAGALVKQGQVIPTNSLAVGAPAKVIREVKPEEREQFSLGAKKYREKAMIYKDS